MLDSLTRNGFLEEEAGEAKSNTTKQNSRVGSKNASTRYNVSDHIEKDTKNINLEKIENDSFVDPTFHKMSQAFDEGGATGMLLSNLVTCNSSQ